MLSTLTSHRSIIQNCVAAGTITKLPGMSKSDVLVENPAWKVAREALQTIEDGKPKQDKNEHPQNEQAGHQYMNQPPGFFTPPPPPRPAAYNYNNGYNYYPSPGFYGGYNQR